MVVVVAMVVVGEKVTRGDGKVRIFSTI